MRASARRSTARSSGGTTRPLSATPTRRRTRRHGGRRRRTRLSRTRTCTGPTRRRQGGRPGRSRPRLSTSAARPEACKTAPGETERIGGSGIGPTPLLIRLRVLVAVYIGDQVGKQVCCVRGTEAGHRIPSRCGGIAGDGGNRLVVASRHVVEVTRVR